MVEHNWTPEVRALTLEMVRVPSVTGTTGEREFAPWLHELLSRDPYFVEHPEHLRLDPIDGDPLGRANLYALVQGEGERCVALAGHYDVVTTANYGSLEPWAFDPVELLPRLVRRLRTTPGPDGDDLALRDLESREFLPGRGILDMKSGLAAGIAVMRRFASLPRRTGNMLLVATPDEEDRSAGMRWAAKRMDTWNAGKRIAVQAAINLDATSSRGLEDECPEVYMGSVGKLLLSVLVIGQDAHAGFPFEGVNSAYLAAEVARRFEWAPTLVDGIGTHGAAPPVCLQLRDLKPQYDVSTPRYTWGAWNILTHRRSASEVLAAASQLAREALSDGLSHLASRAGSLGVEFPESENNLLTRPIRVITYDELRRVVSEARDRQIEQELHDLGLQLAADPGLDLLAASSIMTRRLWEASGLSGPAAVVGFASVPYPSVSLESGRDASDLLLATTEETASVARDRGIAVRLQDYYPGISDMSFLGIRPNNDLDVVERNTPSWRTSIRWDVDEAQAGGIPIVNIGPWGRGCHQWLERVHEPYSFGVAPELVWRVALRILGARKVDAKEAATPGSTSKTRAEPE